MRDEEEMKKEASKVRQTKKQYSMYSCLFNLACFFLPSASLIINVYSAYYKYACVQMYNNTLVVQARRVAQRSFWGRVLQVSGYCTSPTWRHAELSTGLWR